jgi:hypothetical protein
MLMDEADRESVGSQHKSRLKHNTRLRFAVFMLEFFHRILCLYTLDRRLLNISLCYYYIISYHHVRMRTDLVFLFSWSRIGKLEVAFANPYAIFPI